MIEIDKKDIVTVNLKYGSSAKPLKTLAFAQLSAKALFLSGGLLETRGVASEIAGLIGIKNISEDLIKKGLDYLEEINKVRNKDGKWTLCEDARKEISRDIDSARYQVKKVLDRHFPSTIEKKKLKNWFMDAAAVFFGHYGDEWVSAISKGLDKKVFLKNQTIDDLLSLSIKMHHLEDIKQALVDGFIKFLSSDDISDQQYLMLISQAMFSARLVAADVGVDPLTLQELKDSKFILDTNVLFSIALESSRLAKSINSLEGAFKTINANLIYLFTTKEEYGRALIGKKGEILHLLDIFPDEIIRDVSDDFVATAKARGCVTKEDYERFFRSLSEIPQGLPDGYKIILEDDSDIEKVKETAEKNNELKKQIQKYALKIRPKWRGPKSESALNHDSTLLCVADFIKDEGAKCWILSLDRALQACAINRAGPHGMPSLLSLSALIEILAVNNAGPELDSTNFAPLLAKIILNDCMPPLNTYIIQDLNWLHKINEKAAELPLEDIREIVKEITKARIEGKVLGNTSLELKVNRMYQESTIKIKKGLEDAKKRAEIAEETAKKERLKREDREGDLVAIRTREIKRTALSRLIWSLIFNLIIATLFSGVVFLLYWRFFDRENKREAINYSLAVATFIISIWKKIPNAILKYKKTCREAKETVLKEINKNV